MDHEKKLIEIFHYRLDPYTEQKFGQLLAMEQDQKRGNRVGNDNVCQMCNQLQTGEREVRFMNRRKNNC